MSHVDYAPAAPLPEGAKPRAVLSRGVALGILAMLVGFIFLQVRSLWGEWQSLQLEMQSVRRTTVVGYQSINTNPNYAAIPEHWLIDEGDQTLLWSGWTPGVGHGWFRVKRGEVDSARISPPLGRDVVQAIDWPVVEVGGGMRWERIPYDAEVAGLTMEGIPSVYPLVLLRKVEIVNDSIRDHPVLVVYTPFVPEDQSVNVYDPVLDGERLTLGSSGYFQDRKPLLYDRGTESLWLEQGNVLTAVAGKRKGSALKRIVHPQLVTWGDWRSEHPQSRLIVGADRSKGRPTYYRKLEK